MYVCKLEMLAIPLMKPKTAIILINTNKTDIVNPLFL